MNWISVAERLPETTAERQMVIVATDKGVGIAKYNKINKFYSVTLNGSTQYSNVDVIYWMPLPSAP